MNTSQLPWLRYLREAAIAATALTKPPPNLSVWAWGELRRRMGKNVTAKPGRYRVAFTPYQREPQESFTDPAVQVTVLYWGKRLGKTEMLNNLHGSVIEQDPRNILHVMPTLDSAKKWSKQFLVPMVRSTPALRARMKETGRREANNTILAKEYPGGTISGIGANSPSGFRQVQAPVVTCDEIDAMENGPEGDPVELAFGRAENYRDSIQVVSSTATRINQTQDESTKGSSGSRIHDWFLKSDQRKWFVPCPDCGKFHVLAWMNVKWPAGHKHELAWYQCPDCGSKWDDEKRVAAVMKGEWRATAPFNGIRGYWLNGLNTTFPAKKGYASKLHQMAAEFYRAYKGGEASQIVWKNTFLCEPHEETAERMDFAPLLDRGEDYFANNLPESVICLLAGVDVQKDRLEVEIAGLGLDDESWGVQSQQIFGDTEQGEVWQDLAQLLGASFKREDGAILKVSAAAIDMRHKPKRVRDFVRTCGLARVYPVYGLGSDLSPIMVTTRFNKHHKLRVYGIATKIAKDLIFAKLRVDEPGPRYCHFPKGHGYNEAYFQQLTAEVLKTKYLHGFPKKYYEKIRDRNEALDIRVYWEAAIDILKPNLTAIERQLKAGLSGLPEKVWTPPDPAKPVPIDEMKPQPTPKQRLRPLRPGGGFVGGWRK